MERERERVLCWSGNGLCSLENSVSSLGKLPRHVLLDFKASVRLVHLFEQTSLL